MSPSPQVVLGQRGRVHAFREGRFGRARRQAVTIARAVRAGRARVHAAPTSAIVDGEALRDLLAGEAAEAQLVEIPANRRPWTTTEIRVSRGEAVTWLAWGRTSLIWSLGLGAGPSLGLLGRIQGGRRR